MKQNKLLQIKLAYDKAKNDRADTFARKSLALNSELKSSQIEATRILAEKTMDAASVSALQKNANLIQAKIDEIAAEVLGGNAEYRELLIAKEYEKAAQLKAVLQQQIDGQTAGYRKSLQETQTYLNKLIGISPPTGQSSGVSKGASAFYN